MYFNLIFFFCYNCRGLDIECTEINLHIKQKVLNDIKSIKNNHKLCSGLKCIKPKPTLFAKHIRLLKNWVFVGKWLLQIYDYIFENFEHSVIIIFNLLILFYLIIYLCNSNIKFVF